MTARRYKLLERETTLRQAANDACQFFAIATKSKSKVEFDDAAIERIAAAYVDELEKFDRTSPIGRNITNAALISGLFLYVIIRDDSSCIFSNAGSEGIRKRLEGYFIFLLICQVLEIDIDRLLGSPNVRDDLVTCTRKVTLDAEWLCWVMQGLKLRFGSEKDWRAETVR